MISFDEFQKMDEYSKFIQDNPSMGSLKVNVFTGGGAIPLENTEISITKQIGSYQVLFFDGVTNSSGSIDSIFLPTPRGVTNNMEVPLHTFYELNATHRGYQAIKHYIISMYGDTKVIQYVKLIPEVDHV